MMRIRPHGPRARRDPQPRSPLDRSIDARPRCLWIASIEAAGVHCPGEGPSNKGSLLSPRVSFMRDMRETFRLFVFAADDASSSQSRARIPFFGLVECKRMRCVDQSRGVMTPSPQSIDSPACAPLSIFGAGGVNAPTTFNRRSASDACAGGIHPLCVSTPLFFDHTYIHCTHSTQTKYREWGRIWRRPKRRCWQTPRRRSNGSGGGGTSAVREGRWVYVRVCMYKGFK